MSALLTAAKICNCGCGQEVKGRGQYRHGHRPLETKSPIEAFCGCGCGNPLPDGRSQRYYRPKYLQGHGHKGRPSVRRIKPPPDWTPPTGICECGCGGRTKIAKATIPALGYFFGYPVRFLPGHKPLKGRYIGAHGYVMIYRPEHPDASRNGYVLEHRAVWEDTNGQKLTGEDHIHHLDGDKANNAPENLIRLSRTEHQKIHHLGFRRTRNGGRE